MKATINCRFAGAICAAIGMAFSALTASAEVGWATGSYADDEYVQVANRLNGDGGAMYDGKTTTYQEVSTGNEFSYSFDDPTDIMDVRIYSTWGDTGRVGFKIANLQVKCDGTEEFVEVPDTGIDYHSSSNPSTNRLYAALGGGCIATRVKAVKIIFEKCQNSYIGVGEIEVAGTPSVTEALTAQYLAAGGQYSAKFSATAAEYPLDVYFCRGATDGGTTVDDWDRRDKVGTLNSANDVVEVAGTTDFAYCRAYFASSRYGENVWSDGLAVSVHPSVAVTVGERTANAVELIATVQSPGASSSSCDLYFAYAPAGEELPKIELLKSDMAVGESYTNRLTGLTVLTSYDYKFVVRNDDSGETTLTGTFSTLAAGTWQLTPFESLSEYAFPEDWLPNSTSAGGVSGTADWEAGEDKALNFAFAVPKDIKRIDFYTYDGSRRCVALANLKVKYSGADDFVELPGTALEYRTDVGVNGIRYSLVPNDDFVAKNVVGIKVIVTQAQGNFVHRVGADVIGVPHDYTGEYKWDFNYVDGVNFQRPKDVVTDAATTTVSANESDGAIATLTERYKGATYEWTFYKPHDISSIGLFSNTNDTNRNSFSVESVEIKRKGDTAYSALPAIPFDYFSRGSNIVSCVLRPTGKCVVREVTAVRVTLGNKQSSWVPSYMAEVYLSGSSSWKGILVIFR